MASYVHGFYTAAGYDEERRPIPAGLDEDLPYAGTLLCVGDTPRAIDTYDVYWSPGNISMGLLSQRFEWRGTVDEFFSFVPHSMSAELYYRSREEIFVNTRNSYMRYLCGYGEPIHQFWVMSNAQGGSDLYVQTIGQTPADEVSHYGLDVSDATRWWTVGTSTYIENVTMPAWVVSAGQGLIRMR